MAAATENTADILVSRNLLSFAFIDRPLVKKPLIVRKAQFSYTQPVSSNETLQPNRIGALLQFTDCHPGWGNSIAGNSD